MNNVLASEMLRLIFQHTNHKTLHACCQVNRAWYAAGSELYWHHLSIVLACWRAENLQGIPLYAVRSLSVHVSDVHTKNELTSQIDALDLLFKVLLNLRTLSINCYKNTYNVCTFVPHALSRMKNIQHLYVYESRRTKLYPPFIPSVQFTNVQGLLSLRIKTLFHHWSEVDRLAGWLKGQQQLRHLQLMTQGKSVLVSLFSALATCHLPNLQSFGFQAVKMNSGSVVDHQKLYAALEKLVSTWTSLTTVELMGDEKCLGVDLDAHIVCGYLSQLPRLHTLTIHLCLFQLYSDPTDYPVFPKLEQFKVIKQGAAGHANDYLSKCGWPRLQTFRYPLVPWTSAHVRLMLDHAPYLRAFKFLIPLAEPAHVWLHELTATTRPFVTSVRMYLEDDVRVFSSIVDIHALRTAFPHAHISKYNQGNEDVTRGVNISNRWKRI